MFTKKSSALFLVLALAVSPMAAMAQSTPTTPVASTDGAVKKVKWDAMTPDQKKQAVIAHEAKEKAMTPAERASAKAKHEARIAKMTPEQQAKMKSREAERKEIKQSLKGQPVSGTPAVAPAQ
jgi:hypothetical protein